MILTLGRGARQEDLGTFQELVFCESEVRAVDGTVLALHLHNRWIAERGGEPFIRLDLVGPLIVRDEHGGTKLGPYENMSCIDGVKYVDDRVFGFWDLSRRDWYLVDLGVHWTRIVVCRAGP